MRWGLIFISPAAIYFLIFWLFPLALALFYSFTDWSIGADPSFVGVDNYKELLGDPLFGHTVRNSLWIAFLSVSISLVLALGLATVLNDSGIKGGRLFRLAIILPVVTDWVATGLVWQLFFLPNQGVLASIGADTGLTALVRMRWTADRSLAPWAIAIFIIWKQTGLYTIFFLAGLKGISREVIDAARVDGASAWQQFWGIRWPLMKPITVFVVIVSFITTAGLFEPVFLLTAGGPVDATRTVPLFLFENFFTFGRSGYASAAGIYFLGMCLAFAFVSARVLRDSYAR